MNNAIHISFGPTKSRNFKDAVRLSKRFESIEIGKDHVEISTHPVEIFRKWDTFSHLFHVVRNWVTFVLTAREKLIPKSDLSSFFYKVQEVYYFCREKELDPNYKESFEWGCPLIKSIRLKPLPFLGGNYWYHYGHFDKNVWIIEKEKIRTVILNEIIEKYIDFCPDFDMKYVGQKINDLPEEIDLTKNEFFRIIYEKKFIKDRIVRVPKTIVHDLYAAERIDFL